MSTLTETPRPSLLSDKSLSVVRATASVVAAHADKITAHFYPRMFAAHPELLRVFNQGNHHSTTSCTESPTNSSLWESARSSTRSSESTCSPQSVKFSAMP